MFILPAFSSILSVQERYSLSEKCPYSKLFSPYFHTLGKYGPEKTPNTDTFYAVFLLKFLALLGKTEFFSENGFVFWTDISFYFL